MGIGVFEEGFCTLCKLPLNSENGRTQHRRSNHAEIELRTILGKKRNRCRKSGPSKNCISGSQDRWAFGLCMEVIQSLESL